MNIFLQAPFRSTLIALCLLAFICLSESLKAQSNNCAAPTPLTSAPVCPGPTAGTLVGSTYVAIPNACGAAAGNRDDVWYSFVAPAANPTITISGNLALVANQPSMQLYLDCAGNLAPSVPNCVTNNAVLAATNLTPGTTYLLRVFSNVNTKVTFGICITYPSNDLCGSAITLPSSTVCMNTPGTVFGAGTVATTINAPNCAPGGILRDVWYKFTAQTTNPSIKLTGIGASMMANGGIQLLSNNCGGSFNSFYCGTLAAGVATINADFLTPGTVYFIRIYSTGGAPASAAAGAFNICVTDPVVPPPGNDECDQASNISVGNACVTIPGTMAGATPSAVPLAGACAGPNVYDVWYKFTAVTPNQIITETPNPSPNNFNGGGIEVFSTTAGDCSTLTSIACGVSPLNANGLTPGNTYYVRIYSNTAPAPTGNARFDLCIISIQFPAVRSGNSYVNMSKKTQGGVVEKGDTLEIRMTFQYSLATNKTNIRFVDNVPTKTAMLATINDSIRIITNEGLTYKKYTVAPADDAGTYNAAPPAGQYNIRLNVGFASNPGTPVNTTSTEFASATGTMNKTNKPSLFNGSVLFAIAYRVKVTGNPGDTIVLNPAQFLYRTGGLNDTTLTGTSYKILITTPMTLCNNSIGLNNAEEFGGTFGTGTAPNRLTDLTVPIQGYSFINDINAYNSLATVVMLL
jgi:hypothetical protein